MKVSIVIPWFNTIELAKKNLPSVVAAMKETENNILEVVLVDDKSANKSLDFIRTRFPAIRIIQHKVNRGFTATVNTGVRSAKGDFICLLNSDVAPEKNFLKAVYKDFDDPRVFAVSFNEKGEFSWAKGFFRNGFIEYEQGLKVADTHITFWASGGSAIFRRKVWIEIGGFDEKLYSPFYWEDLDISYRAQKRGYKILWEPKAIVDHKHEESVSKLNKSWVDRVRQRNQLLFIWKNVTSIGLFRKHIAGLIKRVLLHPGYIVIVIFALTKLGAVIKARRREIRESKVSDEAVLARFS